MDHADFNASSSYSYDEALQVFRELELPRDEQIQLYFSEEACQLHVKWLEEAAGAPRS